MWGKDVHGADPFVSSCSHAVINMYEKVAHARTGAAKR